jgi:hypothetical protein
VPKKSPVKKAAAKRSASKTALQKPVAVDTEVKHISPEEAVAHIQALLDAKHERVQAGPTWPDAAQPHASGSDLHPPVSGEGGGGDGRVLSTQRGDQGKRRG